MFVRAIIPTASRPWCNAIWRVLLLFTVATSMRVAAENFGPPPQLPAPLAVAPATGPQYLNPIQLGELVARIALYPDDLIGIILPASTFPLQIVEAARYLVAIKSNSLLRPDDNWDNAVVALLNYPDVVNLLDRDLEWTQRLGNAVLNQHADVISAVSQFRAQAQQAGNLRSDERQIVENGNEGAIVIRPANPQVMYVPYYDPGSVILVQRESVFHYYPRPYPVYYYHYDQGYPSGFTNFWGVSSAFSIGWSLGRVRIRDFDYFDDPFYDRQDRGYFYRRARDNRGGEHEHEHDGERDDRHDHRQDNSGGDRHVKQERAWQPTQRINQGGASVAPVRGADNDSRSHRTHGRDGDRQDGQNPAPATAPVGISTPTAAPTTETDSGNHRRGNRATAGNGESATAATGPTVVDQRRLIEPSPATVTNSAGQVIVPDTVGPRGPHLASPLTPAPQALSPAPAAGFAAPSPTPPTESGRQRFRDELSGQPLPRFSAPAATSAVGGGAPMVTAPPSAASDTTQRRFERPPMSVPAPISTVISPPPTPASDPAELTQQFSRPQQLRQMRQTEQVQPRNFSVPVSPPGSTPIVTRPLNVPAPDLGQRNFNVNSRMRESAQQTFPNAPPPRPMRVPEAPAAMAAPRHQLPAPAPAATPAGGSDSGRHGPRERRQSNDSQ